jgi:hypothetical protein
MQTASPTLINALKTGYMLKPAPHLIAEWNQNRYGGILKVDNDPVTSGADINAEYSTATMDERYNANLLEYPITSIVEPNRPAAGIIKARTATARPIPYGWSFWRRAHVISGEESFTAEDYTDNPGPDRYYTVGKDAGYKYWSSPGVSSTTVNANGGYYFAAGEEVRPYVIYKVQSMTNKIVIGFENYWAVPKTYAIQITVDGGTTWTTVASNIAPDVNGRVIVYRQSDNSWGTTVYRENPTRINGVKLVVTDITKGLAHVNLIEISARLEADLTPYLQSWDYTADISDTNFITPLGRTSANVGTVNLYNDGTFNNENQNSNYYHIIDKNVKMTLDLTYDLTDYGASLETIRQFTLYVDNWGSQESLDAQVSLKDSSKFFQEMPLPKMLIENVTVGEAVWRICDSIGFTKYMYDKAADDEASSIDYFWTETDATVWDTLTKLAEGTQTAIFFDEYDFLRIRTRNAAFNKSAPISWAFEATTSAGSGRLPDIVDSSDTYDFESNKVAINYTNTHLTDYNNGFPVQEVIWQPDGDFVLRASSLMDPMTTTSSVFRINAAESVVWPYSGIVNIEGELIKYAGKYYAYYDKTNTKRNVWLKSLDDKTRIDKTLSSDTLGWMNNFTGHFLIVERGHLWSGPRPHASDITGYNTAQTYANTTAESNVKGWFSKSPDGGYSRIATNSRWASNHWLLVRRGSTLDTAPAMLGTRLKFNKAASGSGAGLAGIHFMAGVGGQGYYAEVVRTDLLDANNGAWRKYQHEVSFYKKDTSGKIIRLGGSGNLGARTTIAADVWYTLEVQFKVVGGTHQIGVWLDGQSMFNFTLGSSIAPVNGRYGLFQRGAQTTDFDFLYGIDTDVVSAAADLPDDISSWNYIEGGYTSNQFGREYVFSTRDATRRVGKKNVKYRQRYNQYFYDEFGPVVREVREMNVEFTKTPAYSSSLYFNNDAQVVCAEYTATPFGAQFLLANSSRKNAIVNGDDQDNQGNSLAQHLMINGRLITQDAVATETVQSDDRIRRAGAAGVTFESKYIQSKAQAVALGTWITQHWADGTDNISINTFGNPIVQIGDMVTVDYPLNGLSRTTHRYFVTSIKKTWDNGLDTSYSLRRTA